MEQNRTAGRGSGAVGAGVGESGGEGETRGAWPGDGLPLLERKRGFGRAVQQEGREQALFRLRSWEGFCCFFLGQPKRGGGGENRRVEVGGSRSLAWCPGGGLGAATPCVHKNK